MCLELATVILLSLPDSRTLVTRCLQEATASLRASRGSGGPPSSSTHEPELRADLTTELESESATGEFLEETPRRPRAHDTSHVSRMKPRVAAEPRSTHTKANRNGATPRAGLGVSSSIFSFLSRTLVTREGKRDGDKPIKRDSEERGGVTDWPAQ